MANRGHSVDAISCDSISRSNRLIEPLRLSRCSICIPIVSETGLCSIPPRAHTDRIFLSKLLQILRSPRLVVTTLS